MFYLLNFQVYVEDLKYLCVKLTYHANNNNTHTNKNKRNFASVKFMVHYQKYFQIAATEKSLLWIIKKLWMHTGDLLVIIHIFIQCLH